MRASISNNIHTYHFLLGCRLRELLVTTIDKPNKWRNINSKYNDINNVLWAVFYVSSVLLVVKRLFNYFKQYINLYSLNKVDFPADLFEVESLEPE